MIASMFLLNCIGLILIAKFTWVIYQRTQNLMIIGGVFLIYFWSIAGSWFFLFDELTFRAGEAWGLHYYYIFRKMFSVRADAVYRECLIFYHLFIVMILTALYFLAPSAQPYPAARRQGLNHSIFLLSALSAFILSFLIIYPDIEFALRNHLSVYTTTRNS